MNAKRLQSVSWGVSLVSLAVAVIGWGQGNRWHIESMYRLFPLFGLVAFSLMWSHYVAAVARLHFKLDKAVLRSYFEVTSLGVLAAILLHPGLLAYQLWRDGVGLPPISELHYLASDVKVFVILGMIGYTVFLAYEFRRLFDTKPWWKFVSYASDIAMLLIIVHSLKIGSQLQTGWLRMVWYFYTVTLLGALGYIYYQKLAPKATKP